jgi:DNA (cytosine-5)-methyltransferase 1
MSTEKAKSSDNLFKEHYLISERVKMENIYNVFSLFSGAGGLDLGFDLTKQFRSRFGNELKFHPAQTWSNYFKAKLFTVQPALKDSPAVFNGNVADLKFDKFEGFQPDVIIGGPPCQDFSVVRGPQSERAGIGVTRGKLYAYYVDALIHLQPKFFVFENVPGLISANDGIAYETILKDFKDLRKRQEEITALIGNYSEKSSQNYTILFSDIVNASKLGVPQARRRLIIIGIRTDLMTSVNKERETKNEIATKLKGEDRLVGRYPLTPLEVFEGKPLPELQEKYSTIMKEYEGVAEEVKTEKALKWKRIIWSNLSFDVIKDYLTVNKIIPKNEIEVKNAFKEHVELLKELGYYGLPVSKFTSDKGCNAIPKDGKGVEARMNRTPPDENHEFVNNTEWAVEGHGMSLIYRRLHPLKPAPTVVAFGGGGTWGYHYERKRATITNRERARLQTFPDNFCFEGNRQEVRAQIGEAVPPLLAKRIAQIILAILKENEAQVRF